MPLQGFPVITGKPQQWPGDKLGSLLHTRPGQSLSQVHTLLVHAPPYALCATAVNPSITPKAAAASAMRFQRRPPNHVILD